jgi:formate hydrogenlyase transcriptional activator
MAENVAGREPPPHDDLTSMTTDPPAVSADPDSEPRRMPAPEAAFDHLAAELATTFVDVPAEAVDDHIEAALGRVATALDLDRGAVAQWVDRQFQVTHQWVRGRLPRLPTALVPDAALPWLAERLFRQQQPLVLSRLGDLPPEASIDRAFAERVGAKASVVLPLVVAGMTMGGLSFDDLRREREWPAQMVDRLRLIAQIVANALNRKGVDLALRRAHAFEALVAELSTTLAGLLVEPIDGQIETTLQRIADFLGADRATVLQARPLGTFVRTHQWVRPGWPGTTGLEDATAFPWTVAQVVDARAPVVFARLDELPPAAAPDRAAFERLGIQSAIVRPLVLDDQVLGAVVFGALASPRRWAPELVARLGLVAELVASTLARHRADAELRAALTENERLRARLEAENRYLQAEVRQVLDVDDLVGRSSALRAVLHQVDQVAVTDVPVLLLGETGTGKELLAHAIHARSGRGARPLIAVNCAALPPPLIESELFGHEKGAYTGATHARPGRFELADGSTLFLDEIGDLDPAIQAKLLRVLQDGEVQRLGASRPQKVDVRILAATNRDLEEALRSGRFRADLYYRLSVFPVSLPPLRARREDIPLLVWHFIQTRQRALGRHITAVPPAVMAALVAYDWPGNVRELQNVIDRALILSRGPLLQVDEALGPARAGSSHLAETATAAPAAATGTLQAAERAHILAVLTACHWVVEGPGQAADRLGLRPSTLRHRMKKLGIHRSRKV